MVTVLSFDSRLLFGVINDEFVAGLIDLVDLPPIIRRGHILFITSCYRSTVVLPVGAML